MELRCGPLSNALSIIAQINSGMSTGKLLVNLPKNLVKMLRKRKMIMLEWMKLSQKIQQVLLKTAQHLIMNLMNLMKIMKTLIRGAHHNEIITYTVSINIS